jgi:two-component system, OmpR family, phosphate regulon response regulator PhoB
VSSRLRFFSNTAASSLPNDSLQFLTIGDLGLDRATLVVTLRDSKLLLHPIQVRILEFLMLNPGHAFTRKEIVRNIWSVDNPVDDRTVDVSIGRIRDAIKHKVAVDPIRTVRGVGYAFNQYFAERPSLPKKRRMLKRVL